MVRLNTWSAMPERVEELSPDLIREKMEGSLDKQGNSTYQEMLSPKSDSFCDVSELILGEPAPGSSQHVADTGQALCPPDMALPVYSDLSAVTNTPAYFDLRPTAVTIDDGLASPSPLSSPDTMSPFPMSSTPDIVYPVKHLPGGSRLSIAEESQLSLVQRSNVLCLDEDTIQSALSTLEEDILSFSSSSLWACEDEPSNKVSKSSLTDSPSTTSNSGHTTLDVTAIFDAGAAVSDPQFMFTKFGSTSHISPSQGSNFTTNTVSSSSVRSSARPQPTIKREVTKGSPPAKKQKDPPSLNQSFPSKMGKSELQILIQPESQHRARYMTEGSRGSVKDESQQTNPVVKLFGYQGEATLQVFVGCDAGKVRPHGFYQACRVSGKNSTPCDENEIEGTCVIEIPFDHDMQCSVDSVGILKLRNADVEQRIGLAKSKKKSTKARLVFRVTLPREDGGSYTLQIASSTIMCKQLAGQPEICRKSIEECLWNNTTDMFLIGKNFVKGCRVVFSQYDENNAVVWEAVGKVDQEYFQPTHLIAKIPNYQHSIERPVSIQVTVQCGDRISEPHTFTYLPESGITMATTGVQQTNIEQPMAVDHTQNSDVIKEVLGKWVSPEAIKLSEMCQQQDGEGIFRIPESVPLSPIIATTTAPPISQPMAPEENIPSVVTASTDGLQLQAHRSMDMDVMSYQSFEEEVKELLGEDLGGHAIDMGIYESKHTN